MESVVGNEKFREVLGLLFSPGRGPDPEQDLRLGCDLLKTRCSIVLGDFNGALELLDGVNPCNVERYQLEVWASRYLDAVIGLGLGDDVVRLITECLAGFPLKQVDLKWLCNVYAEFLDLGKRSHAAAVRACLIHYDSSLEKALDAAGSRLKQRNAQGDGRVESVANSVLSRVFFLINNGFENEADAVIDIVRVQMADCGLDMNKFNVDLDSIISRRRDVKTIDAEKVVALAERAYGMVLEGKMSEAKDIFLGLEDSIPKNYYVLMGLLKIAIAVNDRVGVNNYFQAVVATYPGDSDACLACFDACVFIATSLANRSGVLREKSFNEKLGWYNRAYALLNGSGVRGHDYRSRMKVLIDLGFEPRFANRNITVESIVHAGSVEKEIFDRIRELLVACDYREAVCEIKQLVKVYPKYAVDCSRCLFEIALITCDFDGAESCLSYLRLLLRRGDFVVCRKKLEAVKRGEVNRSVGSVGKNSFWERIGVEYLDPVDRVAARVSGFRKGMSVV